MNILDRRFVYVPSHKTDIRVLFERERKRIAEEQVRKFLAERPHLVTPTALRRSAS